MCGNGTFMADRLNLFVYYTENYIVSSANGFACIVTFCNRISFNGRCLWFTSVFSNNSNVSKPSITLPWSTVAREKNIPSKDGIFSIEMRLFRVGYEKLGSIWIRSRVGHRYYSLHMSNLNKRLGANPFWMLESKPRTERRSYTRRLGTISSSNFSFHILVPSINQHSTAWRYTSFPCSSRISHLYHESFDVPMYQGIVVVSTRTKR
jgi:hypothetical protein